MLGLSIADIAVILVYFGVILGIGFWSMRRIRNQEGFFLANRRFGKWVQTFAAFGQATNADSAPSVTTTTVNNGVAGIWSGLHILFATPFYWFTSPWYRRMRVLTLGDYFEERYCSRALGAVYAVVATINVMLLLSLGFNALGKTVMVMLPEAPSHLTVVQRAEAARAVELDRLEATDYRLLTPAQKHRMEELRIEHPRKVFSHVTKGMVVGVTCLIVLLYSVAGGLEAAFLTDTIQGICIIILSMILFPFALVKINAMYGGHGVTGALAAVHQHLPASFFDVFGAKSNIDFTWYYILAVAVMSTVNVAQGANQVVTNGSARNEFTARLGFSTGNYLKRFCVVAWGVLALVILVLYGKQVQDPDVLWGVAVHNLLAPMGMGLVGLVIACFMASLMSTADCMMITSSSLLTRNLYRLAKPGRSEQHYVMVGRILGAITLVGGAFLATRFDDLLQNLKLQWELGIVFAGAFWLGILWRHANRKGAWAAIVFSGIFFFALPALLPVVMPSLRTNPYLLKMTQARTVVRTFVAHEADVIARNREIQAWDVAHPDPTQADRRPDRMTVGSTYSKTVAIAPRSIFWREGLRRDADGHVYGQGMLSLELVLLDKLGFDLSRNPFALNETLRITIRMTVPFLILIVVSLLTKPDDRRQVDRFYAKMKTFVRTDPEDDARELALSMENPHRLDHLKMFPGTSIEICRLTREDVIGFLASCLATGAIVLFLVLIVGLGR